VRDRDHRQVQQVDCDIAAIAECAAQRQRLRVKRFRAFEIAFFAPELGEWIERAGEEHRVAHLPRNSDRFFQMSTRGGEVALALCHPS